MDVCDELLALVWASIIVVTEEHCDWVHRENPEISAASEASDGSRDGKVLKLVLVGYCTFQSVTFPITLRNLYRNNSKLITILFYYLFQAEKAGVSTGICFASLKPFEF